MVKLNWIVGLIDVQNKSAMPKTKKTTTDKGRNFFIQTNEKEFSEAAMKPLPLLRARTPQQKANAASTTSMVL